MERRFFAFIQSRCEVIAAASQKGGAGRTATAVHSGIGYPAACQPGAGLRCFLACIFRSVLKISALFPLSLRSSDRPASGKPSGNLFPHISLFIRLLIRHVISNSKQISLKREELSKLGLFRGKEKAALKEEIEKLISKKERLKKELAE